MERFYLVEYGFFSFVFYYAFRIDRGVVVACLIGWGLVTVVGAVDEMI